MSNKSNPITHVWRRLKGNAYDGKPFQWWKGCTGFTIERQQKFIGASYVTCLTCVSYVGDDADWKYHDRSVGYAR